MKRRPSYCSTPARLAPSSARHWRTGCEVKVAMILFVTISKLPPSAVSTLQLKHLRARSRMRCDLLLSRNDTYDNRAARVTKSDIEGIAEGFLRVMPHWLRPLKDETAELRKRLDALEQRQSATAKELAAVSRKVST